MPFWNSSNFCNDLESYRWALWGSRCNHWWHRYVCTDTTRNCQGIYGTPGKMMTSPLYARVTPYHTTAGGSVTWQTNMSMISQARVEITRAHAQLTKKWACWTTQNYVAVASAGETLWKAKPWELRMLQELEIQNSWWQFSRSFIWLDHHACVIKRPKLDNKWLKRAKFDK